MTIHGAFDYELSSTETLEVTGKSELQSKRARERARKKEKIDFSRGKEAARRVDFIVKSLEMAHEDFLLERAIHSQQGYVGVPDKGQDWCNSSTTGSARLAYLRDVGGYRLVDTSLNSRQVKLGP